MKELGISPAKIFDLSFWNGISINTVNAIEMTIIAIVSVT